MDHTEKLDMSAPEIPPGPLSVEFLQAEVTALRESLKAAVSMREKAEEKFNRYRHYMYNLGDFLSFSLPRDFHDPYRVCTDAISCISELREHITHIHKTRPWPDIGPDPLKQRELVDNSRDGWMRRLGRPVDVQQEIVPDQTALVWRADLNWAITDLITLNVRAKSLAEQNEKLKAVAKAVMDWVCEQSKDEQNPVFAEDQNPIFAEFKEKISELIK